MSFLPNCFSGFHVTSFLPSGSQVSADPLPWWLPEAECLSFPASRRSRGICLPWRPFIMWPLTTRLFRFLCACAVVNVHYFAVSFLLCLLHSMYCTSSVLLHISLSVSVLYVSASVHQFVIILYDTIYTLVCQCLYCITLYICTSVWQHLDCIWRRS